MVIIKKGNILESTENIICHQVNEQGVMGGGLALQIATQYPDVEKEYIEFCNSFSKSDLSLFGQFQLCPIHNNNQEIANCFTQKPNFDTDYEALKECFGLLKDVVIYEKKTICMPYKYGCGIASGDWSIIESILIDIFTDYDIVVYKYDGGN